MSNEPIPAATLILVRDRPTGPPELLMVERSGAMAFAPGATVFPGGRVDPSDVRFGSGLGTDDGGARVAAVRETLEECGIAIGLEPPPTQDQAWSLQDCVLAGADFAPLLKARRFRLRADALIPFARWVPGREVSRRFDTLFFLARATGYESQVRLISGEGVRASWVTAAAALDADRRGDIRLIYPTRKNLERLTLFDSFDAMVADLSRHRLAPITATTEQRGGKTFVIIPKGLGYPITSDPVETVWRG